ncbi:MAG: hypothetical protein M1576_03180 [Deltaproteobacteria bacterium]|nr:hypothetical protein [Deltaproteobacteria bacterium]
MSENEIKEAEEQLDSREKTLQIKEEAVRQDIVNMENQLKKLLLYYADKKFKIGIADFPWYREKVDTWGEVVNPLPHDVCIYSNDKPLKLTKKAIKKAVKYIKASKQELNNIILEEKKLKERIRQEKFIIENFNISLDVLKYLNNEAINNIYCIKEGNK